MYNFFLILFLSTYFISFGQADDFTKNLYDNYDKYKETTLDKRRIKHADILPLIQKIKKDSDFAVKKVGSSIQGRDLHLISIGTGNTSVFLWSQMHGDEPTATQALFDIFNFFNSEDFKKEKEAILKSVTLHFLPMLNPDGAEIFERRNALGIDINRDALRLQSPEGRVLKKIRDSLDADFGFNLHDQSTYYNANRTPKPATISYLAPAFNYEKDIDSVRSNAMKIIVFMNDIIQNYAPGQVGRYNDDFEPRAFGDNITKWGTSAILIESGGYKNDVEKQEIRKLNFVSILSAIYTIANNSFINIDLNRYEQIPENDRKLFDLKIENVTYNYLGKDYILDIGINHSEIDNDTHTDFNNIGRVIDQGDLSTYYGYETVDATGYTIAPGEQYPDILASVFALKKMDIKSLLKQGYLYAKIANIPKKRFTGLPINLLGPQTKLPKDFNLRLGLHANFVLKKDGVVRYAVVNGFLIDLNDSKEIDLKNSLIYR
ncbi:MAG: peptidase M14 [Flavobacteriales bacterium]|nr:MAG: peptidase M14 [Flavobacteriales bacterium]